MIRRIAQTGSVILISSLLLAACGDDDPEPGRVSASWRVDPSGCGAAMVNQVRVFGTRGTSEGFSQSFPCASSSGTIEGVEPGTYTVAAEGLDEQGFVRYRSGEVEVSVSDGGDVSVPGTLALSGAPALIQTNWSFENRRLCAPNMVESIELTLFSGQNRVALLNEDGSAQDATFSCDLGEGALRNVPAGSYTLVVSSPGVGTWVAREEIEVGLGETIAVDVILSQQTAE